MTNDELLRKCTLTDEEMKLVAETSKILCEYLGEGYEQPAYDLTALMLLKVIPIIRKAERGRLLKEIDEHIIEVTDSLGVKILGLTTGAWQALKGEG